MKTLFSRAFLAPILVAMMSLTGPASAALYTGHWDPEFGSPFANLGWSGTVTFRVPLSPSCETSGVTCLGSGATAAYLQSAEVIFYDLANPDHNIATIDWTQSQLSGVHINSLAFGGNGALQYLATGLFPALQPVLASGVTNTAGYGNFGDDLFALQFVIDESERSGRFRTDFSGPRLYWTATGCGGGGSGHDDRTASRGDDDEDDDHSCASGSNDVVHHPPLNFAITQQAQQVPEPASLALVAVALLAAGIASRRPRVLARTSRRP